MNVQCTCDLQKCKAWCCKGFFVDFAVPREQKRYMELHGYEVENGKVQLFVHARCKALTNENKCSLFGTPERPEICNTFDCKGGDFKEYCKKRAEAKSPEA